MTRLAFSTLPLLFLLLGCSGEGSTTGNSVEAAGSATGRAPEMRDAELAPPAGELLETAFRAVSGMPDVPHTKNRCRAQARVVEQCLEMGQVARAARFAPEITDWRRGVAHAALASERVASGDAAGAEKHLALAAASLDRARQEDEQEWRRDAIRARMAEARILLGDDESAEKLLEGAAPSELGRVAELRAKSVARDELEGRLADLQAECALGDFDRIRNALDALGVLYGRFYADEDQRAACEAAALECGAKMPPRIRLESEAQRIEAALSNGDPTHALELLERGHRLLDETRWLPEDELQLSGLFAGLQARAGDGAGARARLARAVGRFDGRLAEVADVFRAEGLRAVAEAYVALGDDESARAAYLRALEEGAANPNARPRAEDLSATCLSMAKSGFEPDAELMTRIREIEGGLKGPW